MKQFRVWLVDTEPQSVVLEAQTLAEAQREADRMLEDGTLWEVPVKFTQSSWRIERIEEE